MNITMKDIPLLLRDKISPDIVHDIVGFHYRVEYETTDWDSPIDNSHDDDELIMSDGTYRYNGLDFLDYYIRNGKNNSLSLSLNSAFIEVYVSKGDKKTIRIEENDYQSIAYGAFEGLRLWLKNIMEEQLAHKELLPVQEQHIHIMATSVSFNTMKEIGSVEFDVPISEKESELLIGLSYGAEYFDMESLRWKDGNLYSRIEKKAEALLEESFGSQPSIVHIHCPKKELWRFSMRCRCMTQKHIDEKLLFLYSMGDIPPIREEVLAGIDNCYIWKEVWTRETGHQWENYTLLKRTPNKDEYDYADTWDSYLIPLKDFSTGEIVKMLKEYKNG